MDQNLYDLASLAGGYILKALANSEGAKTAGKEFSLAIWNWLRPIFLKEEPELVEEVEQNPSAPEVEARLSSAIAQKAAADPEFRARLARHLADLHHKGIIQINKQTAEKIVNIQTNYGPINM